MLVGRGRSKGRIVAAWFWLAFIALLGPVGMYRLDAITVPLALAGLSVARRPPVARLDPPGGRDLDQGLAGSAPRRGGDRGPAPPHGRSAAPRSSRRYARGGRSRAAAAHAFGFVTDQADRGLQLEAPVSTWYLWGAVLGIPGSFIYYDRDLLTFQVTGPEVRRGRSPS